MTLQKHINLNYKECLEEGFGYWIHNGVWYWMGEERGLTFEETKEVFFQTLKKLLDNNKVVFFPPFPKAKVKLYTYYVDGEKDQDELWDETSENIIAYIKEIFPKGITDENDDILTDFWYAKCPEIGWIDQKTGEIVAS